MRLWPRNECENDDIVPTDELQSANMSDFLILSGVVYVSRGGEPTSEKSSRVWNFPSD